MRMKIQRLLLPVLLISLAGCRNGPDSKPERQIKLPVTVYFNSPQLLFSRPGSERIVDFVRTGEVAVAEVVFDTCKPHLDEIAWLLWVGHGYANRYHERPFSIAEIKAARTESELTNHIRDPEFLLGPLTVDAKYLEVWRICHGTTNNGPRAYQIFAGITRDGEVECLLMSSGEPRPAGTGR